MFCAACEPLSEEHLTNGQITYLNNPVGNYGRYGRGAKLRHDCDKRILTYWLDIQNMHLDRKMEWIDWRMCTR